MTRNASVRCHGCGWAMWGIAPCTAEGFGRCPTCGDRGLIRTGTGATRGLEQNPLSRVLPSRPRPADGTENKGYL